MNPETMKHGTPTMRSYLLTVVNVAPSVIWACNDDRHANL
jgi:hypothetical protein